MPKHIIMPPEPEVVLIMAAIIATIHRKNRIAASPSSFHSTFIESLELSRALYNEALRDAVMAGKSKTYLPN